MAETTSKVPVKAEKSVAGIPQPWPFESLRREIDRLFQDLKGAYDAASAVVRRGRE